MNERETNMILWRLYSKKIFLTMNGYVHRTKDKIFYQVMAPGDGKIILKVNNIPPLKYADRHKYHPNDYRSLHGDFRQNARLRLRRRARKEFEILKCLLKHGVRAPIPLSLHGHVVLMEFIRDVYDLPAPNLKNAISYLNYENICVLYREAVQIIWRLYNMCKLVHGNLSEDNLLLGYDRERKIHELCVTGTVQTLHHDHPKATEFLYRDCTNINRFFRVSSVPTLKLNQLFHFIKNPIITEKHFDCCFNFLLEQAAKDDERMYLEQMKEFSELMDPIFKMEKIEKELNKIKFEDSDTLSEKSNDYLDESDDNSSF